MATARIPLRDWDGVAGRSLIQGVKWDGKEFVVAQADDVKGQAEQNTVFRTHDKTMAYTGLTCTVVNGGHGSSFGVFSEHGRTNVLMGHAKLGLVRFILVDGRCNPQQIKGSATGDWTCDQANDLACVRNGTLYIGYTLSSVLAGKPKQLFRTVVGKFYTRFQGHYLTRIGGKLTLIIHGDAETKGHSEMRLLTITSSSKWRTLDTIVTTKMGDEAEGALDYNGRIWVVKRTGGAGAGRTIDLTPTGHYTKKPAPKGVGVWQVHGSAKGYVWARRPGVPASRWEKRADGFKVTTGVRFQTIKFPDLGAAEQFLVTKAGRCYRRAFLRRIK